MKAKVISLVMSFFMLVTVIAGAMPASAAAKSTTTKKTTITTTSSEPKQQYVVPFKDNFTAIRETPNLNDKHPIQVMAYSRGEYCIYDGETVTVKNDDGKTEKWYKVKTVFGQPGYVINWAGKVVSEKPTRPTTTTTTVKKPTTTKKPATTTTKKVTTTTTTQKSSELYLTSTGEYTNIRSGKSTKTSNLGRVYSKDIAVADKKEGNWYHLIILNGKKKVGWCKASLMKEVPAPTTTSTVAKPTTTTASKSSTTTTKKTTTTTAKSDYLYFELGKGQQTVLNGVKVKNTSGKEVKIGFNLKTNTLEIVG